MPKQAPEEERSPARENRLLHQESDDGPPPPPVLYNKWVAEKKRALKGHFCNDLSRALPITCGTSSNPIEML